MARHHATSLGTIAFTPEEELERDREETAAAIAKAAETIAQANALILAVIADADLKIIRAITEGDTTRIAAHVAAQAVLRARLQQ